MYRETLNKVKVLSNLEENGPEYLVFLAYCQRQCPTGAVSISAALGSVGRGVITKEGSRDTQDELHTNAVPFMAVVSSWDQDSSLCQTFCEPQ